MPQKPKSSSKKKKKSKPAKDDVDEEEMELELGEEEAVGKEGEDGMRVWQPGMEEGDADQELEFDPSAYDCLHAMRLEWPCLSFDVLRDSLGAPRDQWPHTMFLAAGTQASSAKANTVAIMRLTSVSKTHKPAKTAEAEDDESDSDSESDMDEDNEATVHSGKAGAPVMHIRQVAHNGGVNRLRACPQLPHLLATLADTASVHVWDVQTQIEQLATATADAAKEAASKAAVKTPAAQTFSGHKDEGYAVDWSPVTTGRLLSGDCAGVIHLWEPANGKWSVGTTTFIAPAGSGFSDNPSVEDLQWSPTEATVFAAASADQTIRIWDTRQPGAPALAVHAHGSDVNVLSWSRLTTSMLASGADDGSFKIWDLRNFKDGSNVAGFTYHKQPVTSIEWSPFESPMVAVGSADNQVSVWDLSVERDLEEEAEAVKATEGRSAAAPGEGEIPPQLMFVHMGQKDLKEIHWHPLIPGMLASTAGDGFNVFRPNNL